MHYPTSAAPWRARPPAISAFHHGLGDCAYFAHLLPLYARRGHAVEVECTPDKGILFQAAGATTTSTAGSAPAHPWGYPGRSDPPRPGPLLAREQDGPQHFRRRPCRTSAAGKVSGPNIARSDRHPAPLCRPRRSQTAQRWLAGLPRPVDPAAHQGQHRRRPQKPARRPYPGTVQAAARPHGRLPDPARLGQPRPAPGLVPRPPSRRAWALCPTKSCWPCWPRPNCSSAWTAGRCTPPGSPISRRWACGCRATTPPPIPCRAAGSSTSCWPSTPAAVEPLQTGPLEHRRAARRGVRPRRGGRVVLPHAGPAALPGAQPTWGRTCNSSSGSASGAAAGATPSLFYTSSAGSASREGCPGSEGLPRPGQVVHPL